MVAYLTQVPMGFPGQLTRMDSQTVESYTMDPVTPPTVYGQFVKLIAGKLQPLASGDVASVITGVMLYGVPTQSASNGFGAALPPAYGIVDVLRRGFVAVALVSGTAVKGGPVFVVTTAGTGFPVGSIVTQAVPATGVAAVQVNDTFFEGVADASGSVEISYNI